jgi:hypothetical protein
VNDNDIIFRASLQQLSCNLEGSEKADRMNHSEGLNVKETALATNHTQGSIVTETALATD